MGCNYLSLFLTCFWQIRTFLIYRVVTIRGSAFRIQNIHKLCIRYVVFSYHPCCFKQQYPIWTVIHKVTLVSVICATFRRLTNTQLHLSYKWNTWLLRDLKSFNHWSNGLFISPTFPEGHSYSTRLRRRLACFCHRKWYLNTRSSVMICEIRGPFWMMAEEQKHDWNCHFLTFYKSYLSFYSAPSLSVIFSNSWPIGRQGADRDCEPYIYTTSVECFIGSVSWYRT